MRVYLEMDSIFDTRASVLKDIGYEIDNDEYINRTSDNFTGVGEDVFKLLYKHRDRNILANAKMTPMVHEANEIMMKLMKENKVPRVELFIDISKYPMMIDEIERYMLLFEDIFPLADIVFMRKPITVDNINKFNVIIKYDGLSLYEEAIFKNPSVLSSGDSLVIPAIVNRYMEGVNLLEELNIFMKANESIMNIVFMDVLYWSNAD